MKKNVLIAILIGLTIGQGINAHKAGEERDRHKNTAEVMQEETLRQHVQYEGARDIVLKQDAKIADLEERLAEAAERERAAKVRASRSRRLASAPPASARAWANQPFSIKVANCESGDLNNWPHSDGTRYVGDPHLRAANGHYGKWQFAPSTWRSVGGTGNAADATEEEQDYRAWLLWKREGWRPWACADMV